MKIQHIQNARDVHNEVDCFGWSYSCKVGIIDNRNAAFRIPPPPLFLSLSSSWSSIISPLQGSVKWCVWLFGFLNEPFLLCQDFFSALYLRPTSLGECVSALRLVLVCLCRVKMPLLPTSRCYVPFTEWHYVASGVPAAHFFHFYPLFRCSFPV